jgi:hypothetical protein
LTAADHDRGESLDSTDLARRLSGRKFSRLRRAWQRLLLHLSEIFVTLTMGVLFFAVVTPAAIVMRLAGRDPLRLRFERERPSYWLCRSPQDQHTSMTRQY